MNSSANEIPLLVDMPYALRVKSVLIAFADKMQEQHRAAHPEATTPFQPSVVVHRLIDQLDELKAAAAVSLGDGVAWGDEESRDRLRIALESLS